MNHVKHLIDTIQREAKDLGAYLGVLLIFALVAYGFQAFNLTLIGDDWNNFVESSYQYDHVVQIGRWIQRVTRLILADNTFAPAFTLSMLVISGFISCWFHARTIGLTKPFSLFLFAAVFMFHPFWVEDVTFKITHGAIAIGLILSGLFGYIAQWASRGFLAGDNRFGLLLFAAVLFSLTAACYQPLIYFGTIAYLLGIINDMLLRPSERAVRPKELGIRLAVLIVVGGVGLGLYVAQINLARFLFAVPPLEADSSYRMIDSLVSSPEQATASLRQFAGGFQQYLFEGQHLFPAVAKYIFLFCLGVLFYYLGAVLLYHYDDNGYRVFLAVSFFILLALVFLIPWLLGILRMPINSYRYRAIIGNAIVYAGVIAIVSNYKSEQLSTWLSQAGAVILILIFVFQHSSAGLVTYTLNQRDMAIVNRIMWDIENHPDYDVLVERGEAEIIPAVFSVMPVLDDRPFAPIDTDVPFRSAIDCGIFDCQTRRLAVGLRLVQYERIHYTQTDWRNLSQERQQELSAEVDKLDPWPGENSIAITDAGEVLIYFTLERASREQMLED